MAYGLTISLSILVCALLAEFVVKKQKLNVDIFWGALLFGLFFGLVGARLYHVLDFWDYYLNAPLKIFALHFGGLGIFGGMFGGLLGIWLYLRHRSEPLLPWLDIAGFVLPLGQALGRFANIANGELIPYAIYESIANFLLFLVILAVFAKNVDFGKFDKFGSKDKKSQKIVESAKNTKSEKNLKKPGIVFFLYLIGYSLIRLILENFREDSWRIGEIKMAQVFAVILALAGIAGIRQIRKRDMPY